MHAAQYGWPAIYTATHGTGLKLEGKQAIFFCGNEKQVFVCLREKEKTVAVKISNGNVYRGRLEPPQNHNSC